MDGSAAVIREPRGDAGTPRAPVSPQLLGVGSATPALGREQSEICGEIAEFLGLRGTERSRWDRIWRGSGIERRHSVVPLRQVVALGTAARMRLFDAHATTLAAAAAERALRDAGVAAGRVTDLVVVTCTGFSAPGVPRRLISELGLASSVRTVQIGFMGCFGGVSGLRSAAAHAGAEPGAVALLVCVELCSLHLRPDRDPQNLVASALFADGAAAAVISADASASRRDAAPLAVRPGASRTIDGTLDAMSWIITDAGFAMTLSREVPGALSAALPEMLPAESTVLLHPGGPAVIEAVETAIPARSASAIHHARAVLRECGNMSSATVLLVLERWLRAGGGPSASVVAFGPGLTVDLVDLAAPLSLRDPRRPTIVPP